MDKVVGDFSYEGVAAIPIGEDMREWKVILTIISGDSRKGRVPERKSARQGI